ncbi:hypothetical protein V1264_002461 [Littorina saxatilis]|uniref:Chitin synthase n=1 Tax=Littorina saxatilis TaxID=31220 RepID=A0AAN9GQX8_9CAEN
MVSVLHTCAGEDRWLSTLLLQQGYRIDFCAASDALTHAPDTFSEFFNQRRRWGPSTLANVVDLLGNWQSAVRLNDNLSSLYVIYQAMMLCSTVLGPSTIILLMAGSFKMVFKISVLGSYALTLIVPALYVALCLYAKPRLQLTVGAGLSALYALVMAIVLVGTVGTVVLGSITSPNVLFLFTVIFVFTVSAVLHPQEFYCILPGVLYLIMLPAGYLVLTIYSLCNLHVVSWGTRETQTVKTHAQIEKEKQEAEEKKAGKKGGILGWLGLHATLKEARHLVKQARAGLFRKEKRGKSKSSPEKSRTDQLLEELIVEIRRDRECSDTSKRKSTSALNRGEHNGETNHGDKAACGREEEAHSDLTQSGTSRREDQERWSQHSQRPLSVHNQGSSSLRSRASSVNDSDNDSSDHEDRDTVVSNVGNHTVIRLDGNPPQPTTTQQPPRPPRHDDVTNPSWLTSEVCGEGPVTQLNERETAFWSQLIHKYLYPLNEDTAHQDKMQADLKSLRNNVVFGFVMVSVIWIALNMQLEALQDDLEMFLYIHIPRMTPGAPPHTFHPLGMVFLVSFALVLLVQFAGMFAHRWGTLLHTLSITEIGVGNSNDERKEVRDAILRVIQLQKLRNIDLEPNPDYDDTTPLSTPTIINPLFVPDIGIAPPALPTLHPSIPPPPSESGFHPSSTRSALHRSHSFRHDGLVGAHRPGDVRRELWEYDVSRGRKGLLGNFTLQRAFEKRFRNEIGSRVNQAGQGPYSQGHVAQHVQPW